MGEKNTTMAKIMEHIVVSEMEKTIYEKRVNELAEEGWLPSSQFGVSMCSDGVNLFQNFHMQMSRPIDNLNYIEPTVKCVECDKEIKASKYKTQQGNCDECLNKSEEEVR